MEFEHLALFSNLALSWIGFGTLIGLMAKAIMPGREAGGGVATILMGIIGALIGCAILQFFSTTAQFVFPTSIEGFIVGCGGALALLAFYKALGGFWFTEGEPMTNRTRRRRRRYRTALDE